MKIIVPMRYFSSPNPPHNTRLTSTIMLSTLVCKNESWKQGHLIYITQKTAGITQASPWSFLRY